MFYEAIWKYRGVSLVRRPDTNSLYIYGLRGQNGRLRRISTHTSDVEEAQRFLMNFVDGVKEKTTEPIPLDLLDALQGYADTELTSKARNDAKSIIKHFRQFCSIRGIHSIQSLTPSVQREFIEWRQDCAAQAGRTLSNGTLNKDLELFRAAMNHWKREGRVTDVPAVRLLPKPPPRERFLEAHEVARLVDACTEPHLYRFVLIALHTLQRPGAVLDLRCSQIDLIRRRIDFRPPGWVQTNKRRPVVPITATLAPVLELAMTESASGHVVEYLGRPLSSIKKSFGRACDRAGLENVTPYTLRHTGATLLAAAGVPLWQISGMMGHSISRTTEIYAKHAPDFLSKAANELDVIYGRTAEGRTTVGVAA